MERGGLAEVSVGCVCGVRFVGLPEELPLALDFDEEDAFGTTVEGAAAAVAAVAADADANEEEEEDAANDSADADVPMMYC